MKKLTYFTIVLMSLTVTFQPSLAMGQFFFLENENVGKPAKDFTLKVAGAEKMALSDLRDGGRAIVFFWATWCPHCRRELSELDKNKAALARKGIKVALVDIGESEGVVQQYMRRNKIDMPVFLDEDNAVAEEYGLVGVPTYYLIDQNGIVRDVQHSLPDDYEAVLEGSS